MQAVRLYLKEAPPFQFQALIERPGAASNIEQLYRQTTHLAGNVYYHEISRLFGMSFCRARFC